MITGITTAVLKGANAPGRANGEQVGEDATELQTQDLHGPCGPIEYDRVVLDGQQAVTRAEPAELSTNPLAAPTAAQPTDSAHDNLAARGLAPGTGRGAGRNQNGTRSR